MTVLEALELAHAEAIASLTPNLTVRRIEARDQPELIGRLFGCEMFASGIDHGFRLATQAITRLQAEHTTHDGQNPLEFETRHA